MQTLITMDDINSLAKDIKKLNLTQRIQLREWREIIVSKQKEIRKDIQYWMQAHPDAPEYMWSLIRMHTNYNGALDMISNYEACLK